MDISKERKEKIFLLECPECGDNMIIEDFLKQIDGSRAVKFKCRNCENEDWIVP